MRKKPEKNNSGATFSYASSSKFGCGIDLVEMRQFKKALKNWNSAFLNRVFTKEELAYSKRYRNSILHLAARFAAKEAVIKAFSGAYPSVNLVLKNIEIRNDESGKPSVIFNGLAKKLKPSCSVSLTHTKNFAAACAWVQK
jgi:holo-[acyl-carrier protein] synthase